jgi:ammonia channel protein AmtB
VLGTILIAKVVGWMTNGLRVDEENESTGLDVTEHGEEGYTFD